MVRTVILLEAAGVNVGPGEQNALREMRNAICHNQFDLSKNSNKSSFTLVAEYQQHLLNGQVPSANPEPLAVFFSLNGHRIEFDRGAIAETCRQLVMKYI